jgi:Protein of unknown function (DUF3592)
MSMTDAALRWRYYGGPMAIVGIAIGLGLGAVFLTVGYFVWQSEEEYAKNGVAATGTVTRKDSRVEPRTGPKSGPRTVYTLHYRYQDDQGRPHEHGDSVDAGVWNQYQKGQQVAIEYLRDKPGTSRVAVRSFWATWGYLFALAGGGLLVGGTLVFGIGGWFWAGRKARLVRDGEPFLGVVTEHDTRTSGKSRQTSYRLRYAFTDAGGTERTGKSCWLPRGLESRWPVDGPILVLQDPANPARFEADIYEARADDLARFQGESAGE